MTEQPVRAPLQGVLVLVVLAYAAVLLVIPLVVIFDEALAEGLHAVRDALTVPDAQRALTLMEQLAAELPGYLVPRLVREEEGQPAKVAVINGRAVLAAQDSSTP